MMAVREDWFALTPSRFPYKDCLKVNHSCFMTNRILIELYPPTRSMPNESCKRGEIRLVSGISLPLEPQYILSMYNLIAGEKAGIWIITPYTLVGRLQGIYCHLVSPFF